MPNYSSKTPARKICWIDLNRFDTKPDKSTWLEMGHELTQLGFQTTVVTSFKNRPFEPSQHDVNVVSLKATRYAMLFRISLLLAAVRYIKNNCPRDTIIIVPVAGLFAAPVLKRLGFRNIHLDVRTVPVAVSGPKRRMDRLLFWSIALRFFASSAVTYSFITAPLKNDVETFTRRSYKDSCIWSSGVRSSLFQSGGGALRRRSDGDTTFRLFYHGTVTKDRGIFEVAEAIGLLHNRSSIKVTLQIVGSGPDVGQLDSWLRTQPFANLVSIVDLVPYESVPSLIDEADCCICPLPPRPEWQVSSPLKVFEYMAMAKPIIATRIRPHLDVLGSQDFVVWAEGHEARHLAAAIDFASRDREHLTHVALAGPELVKSRYDWQTIAMHFSSFLLDRYGAV